MMGELVTVFFLASDDEFCFSQHGGVARQIQRLVLRQTCRASLVQRYMSGVGAGEAGLAARLRRKGKAVEGVERRAQCARLVGGEGLRLAAKRQVPLQP